MKRQTWVAAVAALFISAFASTGHALDAKDIVGAWAQISNVNTNAAGAKADVFGASPKGQGLFTADGRYSIFLHRADMPKIASNNRVQGTDEENKAIMAAMIALYGSYTVEDNTILLKVEGASFPNWIGGVQKRPVPRFTADEMVWLNLAGSAGGQNELLFRRIK